MMKATLTPILALVLSLGLRPADSWRSALHGPPPEAAPVHARSADWRAVDEYMGLDGAPVYNVTVTGYSSTRDQCDSTPIITAANTTVRHGIIALSRDMLRRYNPDAPFDWGDRVHVEGVGEFVVEDAMNARYRSRADIWFPDRESARAWGVQELKLSPVPDNPLSL